MGRSMADLQSELATLLLLGSWQTPVILQKQLPPVFHGSSPYFERHSKLTSEQFISEQQAMAANGGRGFD